MSGAADPSWERETRNDSKHSSEDPEEWFLGYHVQTVHGIRWDVVIRHGPAFRKPPVQCKRGGSSPLDLFPALQMANDHSLVHL